MHLGATRTIARHTHFGPRRKNTHAQHDQQAIAEENPDNTFTPMPRNITPLGMELDPDTGVDLSSKENKN